MPITMQLGYDLRVHKRRLLVPVGRPCPFKCTYCYAGDVSSGEVDSASIVRAVKRVPPDRFDTIQLGYDGDPFASLDRAEALLPALADLGKHLNLSTKARIPVRAVDLLRDAMGRTDAGLSINVSITCWESAARIEPGTPSPRMRLAGAAMVRRELEVPFVVALRPLLPVVPDLELVRVVDEAAAAGATGVVTGPLYASTEVDEEQLLDAGAAVSAPALVKWSPVELRYRRVSSEERIDRVLAAHARSVGIELFRDNSAALQRMRHGSVTR